MISVDTLLEANGISQRTFRQEVGAAFANWSAVADITFAVTDDPAQADILIGAQATPTGFAYANVSYDPTVTGAMHRIDKSLVCLNPRRPWKVGFDGNRDIYDLRYTLTHEIGHAIGLDHPPSSDQLMDFVYREKFQGLQSGDIAGVATLYGAPPMPIAQQRAVTTSMPAVTER